METNVMTDIKQVVGAAIAAARKRKSLTQPGLAHLMEVSVSYVKKVEGGLRNITLDQLQRFAEVLDAKEIEITIKTR